MNFTDNLAAQLEAVGIEATAKQLEQFTTYYEMLIETNKSLNLTAITEPHEVAVKHFVDSLTALDDVQGVVTKDSEAKAVNGVNGVNGINGVNEEGITSSTEPVVFKVGASLLDLGTGAGFPGIPLAIMRPDLKITLFDSLQKRLIFLESVIKELGLLNVTTLHGRAEDVSHTAAHREAYDIVTSRAVARLPILLEWALPYVKQNGYMVALKGAAYEDESKEATKALQILKGKIAMVKPVQLPTLTDKRAIIYVRKMGHTPKPYPRKPKDIKLKPLL
ncbi:16S rRNA (guanine(527)-N(7))-methyltransferase RsmG [Veillonella sp. R32]|uniref:16S rRNA (guanine(527)-N(7))-methyltransferase RsmG n=1 Tax=Veillonella sp. R32 TaxID=2021312 RepID=UPI0013897F51|nr:16S rRNA (guanine(527)-N(7))-methyltransferase RsmG [Veillonella sp. R32]KAF1680707.1 16S rRNA (guanine(527)-N(7))-methyltransferase RsmG [Veillonella sp. R32]